MTLSPEWILGAIITIMAAILGYAFKMIADLRAELRSEDGELSKRLDTVKDTYVRRDDNDGKLVRIEKAVDGMQTDIKGLTTLVISALGREGDGTPRARRGTG